MDEPRLSELIEMYEKLGFEVKTEDYCPDKNVDTCSECVTAQSFKYKVIYTRKTDSSFK